MVLPGSAGPKIRVQPNGDGWRVKYPGHGTAFTRSTKSAAVDKGRQLAKKNEGQLIIYDSNLNIQKSHDYS